MGKTIVIVDDHAGFRASARRILEADGFDVVGEAADGRSGIAAVSELRPQVVLLDVQLPDMDGVAVAGELSGAADPPAVVLTSSHDREDLGDSVAASGARGFIPKGELCGAAICAAVA
jgi:DNA-binding NarL/FixJ family response regulator